jgi:chromosome segregation ATPase
LDILATNKTLDLEDNIFVYLGITSRYTWRCITINGMLIFIVLLLAIAIGVVIFMGKKRNNPIPAIETTPKPFSNNQFKEEFAMEEKTKVIKERVKTAENAKIERVAAAKAEEEIAVELAPLRSQIQSIQNTLNQLNSANDQTTMSSGGQNQNQNQNQNQSNDLLNQLQQFSSQAQQQQQKTFQQLQQSVHQAAQTLSGVEQSIQSINMLNQITQQINQTQQQLQQQQSQGQGQGQGQSQVQGQGQGQMNYNQTH